MPFPKLDPVAFSFGFIVIRWYALAYVVGIIAGWQLCMALAKQDKTSPSPEAYDEFLSWAVVGVILGGRIAYILFYNFDEYSHHPLEAFKVWHGGMSFHGGMCGVILAAWIFTRLKKISFLAFTDLTACVVPIGLGLGRLANFVNGELYGRETSVPWAIIFPRGGNIPRHPSQIYEALCEGLLLFIIMMLLVRIPRIREQKGFLSGTFLILYGLMRFGVEFFREPDPQLGFLFAGATMGQLLCVPMIIAGGFIILWSRRSIGDERT